MKRVLQLFVVAASQRCSHPQSRAPRPACTSASTTTRTSGTRKRRAEMLDQARDANTTIVRTLVTWANVAPDAAGERRRPVRPRLQVQRSRRARAQHAGARHGGPDHDLGNAEVGERRQDAELHADEAERPDRVLARRREPLLGPLRGLPVRALLLDLERVEPAALPRAAVRREGEVGRPAQLREARRRGVLGNQGRQPQAKIAIGSTSSAGRDKPLAGKSATHSPGRFAQLVAAANPRLKFDAWAQHPYPVPANQKPNQKVRWPNVTLSSFAALREVARHLVQAQERAHLDHRVRARGEADGEPNGRLARAAGRLRGAGPRARQGGPAHRHVHLVRLPRPRDERVAERAPHEERRREAVARAVHAAAPLGRRTERDRERPRRRREPDRRPSRCARTRPARSRASSSASTSRSSTRASSSRAVSRPRRSGVTQRPASACRASGR